MENIPGFTTFCFLEQIQEFMKEQECDPEQFKGRIIFMSMFNEIVWGEKGKDGTWTRKQVVRNLL